MKDAPFEIVPYSTDWPQLFALEANELRALLNPWLAGTIEHIGSTAVPGLSAKPVIDIMVPVHSLAQALPAISALSTLDYCYFPYKPKEMLWFCKPSPAFRTHHLHLIPSTSNIWAQRLAFRDALRQDQALVSDYSALKSRLAAAHAHDRDAYTEGKTQFVRAVLKRTSASPS
jgi:GrpB-like predicted nucleotidyltransferase (UPF0157 family)